MSLVCNIQINITDSDISKSYDNTGGVKTTWLNIWNNFLKLKADLLYSSKFMLARTIKANILVTNNNVSDVSFDQFQTALANTSSVGMVGIICSGIYSNSISLFTPPATSSQGESSGTLGNNVALPFNYNTSTCYFIYTMQTDNANIFKIKSLYMNHIPL